MEYQLEDKFCNFLKNDLAIPQADIQLALKHPDQTLSSLPIILWQYGLVTLTQLEQIFDWLEQRKLRVNSLIHPLNERSEA